LIARSLIGTQFVKKRRNPRSCAAPGCYVLAAGVLAAVAPMAASAQISLGTAVFLAQRHSTAVRIAEADVLKTQAALSETRDVYVPSVSFTSGLPAVPSVGFLGGLPSIFSASMQSLVFSPSQRHYINAARAGLRAASLSLKDAREQAALDASTNYIEMDTVNRELDAAREQQDYAERAATIEQERAESGVDPLSDLLQARLTVAELKLRRIHLESRLRVLAKQLSVLTELPVAAIVPDHGSIPEIPQVHAESLAGEPPGVESARLLAESKQKVAKADSLYTLMPQVSFSAQYARYTTLLNNADTYYAHPLKSDNFGSGFNIQVPLFDIGHHAKAEGSAADALRATVEAEQAQRQNEVQIAMLSGNIRELDAMAEVSSLKQQIAAEQLKSVQSQLQYGNGDSGRQQLSPKAEQSARIDERQKMIDALDAGFDLSKARLGLLRALGHMDDWLRLLPNEEPGKVGKGTAQLPNELLKQEPATGVN
jgi:outer membrane protein TolC